MPLFSWLLTQSKWNSCVEGDTLMFPLRVKGLPHSPLLSHSSDLHSTWALPPTMAPTLEKKQRSSVQKKDHRTTTHLFPAGASVCDSAGATQTPFR